MNRHRYADYWDRGARNVPDMTGAKTVLDARDLVAVCEAVGLKLPLTRVLDVGCGTGRLSQLCADPIDYVGVDIAPSAIEYCSSKGRRAMLIGGAADLPVDPRALVACVSVFTHVDVDERRDYLRAFAAIAPELLVDIIPGDGSGGVAIWSADAATFEQDLADAGFVIEGTHEMFWAATHRFYYARLS